MHPSIRHVMVLAAMVYCASPNEMDALETTGFISRSHDALGSSCQQKQHLAGAVCAEYGAEHKACLATKVAHATDCNTAEPLLLLQTDIDGPRHKYNLILKCTFFLVSLVSFSFLTPDQPFP